MTQLTLVWTPENYFAMTFVNMLEKIDDVMGVKKMRRASPVRLVLDCKSERTCKRVMKIISREAFVMKVHSIFGTQHNCAVNYVKREHNYTGDEPVAYCQLRQRTKQLTNVASGAQLMQKRREHTK